MVVRRSSRQPSARAAIYTSNNSIVAIDSSDHEEKSVVKAAIESDSDDDDNADACAACGSDDNRVKVTCATCTQQFHLGCATPPLKRRPVLASAWRCGACAASTADSADNRSSRRRVVAPEVKQQMSAAPANPAAAAIATGVKTEPSMRIVRARGSTNAKTATAAATRSDESANELEPPKKSRRTTTATAASSARAQRTNTAAVPSTATATPPASAKSKRAKSTPPRASAKASTARTKAARPHESDDDADPDNDSDFSAATESDDDDDDVSDASDSSASLKRVKRLPTLKAPPVAKRVAKAKAKAKVPAASSATPRNGGGGGNDDGADSMDLPNTTTSAAGGTTAVDSDDELEAYAGPRYFVEYAANNRAKCKQCEQKLPKDTLRVGVRVKHSIFGLTTYYKHLHCTQMCWSTANDLAASERVEAAAVDTDAVKAEAATDAAIDSSNNASSQPELEHKSNDTKAATTADAVEPICGFESLRKADQAAVRAHMEATEAKGLLDERVAIDEDAYAKKTRMAEKEPSPHLTVPLLPYQREALAWMTAQERSDYRGGILADEMGMGKTIQAIALILENVRQAKNQDSAVKTDVQLSRKQKQRNKVDRDLARGGTLVVCPLVAVMQWKSEIERFVTRNHLSIYIHHGPKRLLDAKAIAAFDIVLTTYSIIESEMRKTLGWEKVACRYCKRKYLPDKLILHNKYFCGPNAKKTALQDKQQSNKNPNQKKRKRAAGETESESDDDAFHPKKPAPKARGRAKGKAPPAKKNAAADSDDDDDDDDDDYNAAVAYKKSKATSPLHQVSWTRIVLDEAHYIKDRRNNTARGVFELKSEYKWCLTGTPLQNRIGELFSLIRFLQIKSYAYYHCNNCECQLLDFHFPNGKCELCDHTAMQHFSFFNKRIVIPIQAYGYVAEGKLAMLRLQNEVLQHILLRRTKQGRADDICLPPKLVRIRKDYLDERENDFYQAIYTQSQAQFNTYVSSGTLLNNYAHIFDLLIRLRQAVDHPYLVIFSKSNPALQLPITSLSDGSMDTVMRRPVVEEKPLLSTQNDASDDERLCTICHEDVEDVVVATCGHDFCRECVKEFIESLPIGADATCPTCSELLTVELEAKPAVSDLDTIATPSLTTRSNSSGASAAAPKAVDLSRYHKGSILHRVSDMHAFQTSTKIEALMQELALMRERDPSGKAIIFSQFVNMLDIIEHRLHLGGVKCVKMSGNMTMDVRDRTIKAFRDDSTLTAFLISLKAGGVALNLTIASHIFLMDPWWNPAAESQAIDRTHRLGQFKPIQATRFIIAGTVEERILKLQEKKRLIFEGTVGASVSAVCRLTAEDLRFLFSK